MKVLVTYGKGGKITNIGVPNPNLKQKIVSVPKKGFKSAEVDASHLDLKEKDLNDQFNKIVRGYRVKVKGDQAVLVQA